MGSYDYELDVDELLGEIAWGLGILFGFTIEADE